jgi:hypothetical protein
VNLLNQYLSGRKEKIYKRPPHRLSTIWSSKHPQLLIFKKNLHYQLFLRNPDLHLKPRKLKNMQFKISFIGVFAAIVAVSQASYYVPADTADGHYRVQLDEHGNTVGAPLKVSNSTSKRSVEILTRAQFPNPSVGCSNYGINGNDFSVTASWLNAWCDSGNQVSPNSVEYWVYQTSLAYICNYASGYNPCSSDEYGLSNALENNNCGVNEAAWVFINDWGKSYGRDNSGAHVCW